MRIIAVINQKGGVGKTTITANLGHALAIQGMRMTLLDLDPQGHLAASLGIFRPPTRGIANWMLAECGIKEVAIRSREHLTLIPAGRKLMEIEQLQSGGASRARMLKQVLNGALEKEDFVLIDCPPSAGLLVANAVLAADEALVPVTGDYLGLNGLAQLMRSLKGFQALRQKPLQYWIALSRFLPRRRLSREVRDKLRQHFPGQVLNTPVNEAAVLAECPGAGRTIFEYRSGSRSAKEFEQLADDLMQARNE